MFDKEEEKEAEEVKTLIKDVERDTAKHILNVLQAIINEQVQSRNLKRETGKYILDAIKNEGRKRGWLE